MLATQITRLGELNPQLFREVVGRCKPRNLAIAGIVSVAVQAIVWSILHSQLPPLEHLEEFASKSYSYYDKYILSLPDGTYGVNWSLWSLELFLTMSIVGSIALLVAGTYMLIDDLSREENRGTLGLVRLSPQSAFSILLGKLLGVPVLLYGAIALALPLHFGAGLAAGISLGGLLSFYVTLLASCAFFFSGALLLGAVAPQELRGFQAWLGSGALLMFAILAAKAGYTSSGGVTEGPFDWLLLLSPGRMLPYLVGQTAHLTEIGDLNPKDLATQSWFGFYLWDKAFTGIGFMLVNYAIGTYWLWQGLTRRFHNPARTLLSKTHSYWLSSSFAVVLLGFTLQGDREWQLRTNFSLLFVLEFIFYIGLIFALSPERQTLYDWARYRHQNEEQKHRHLVTDLIRGEKSPSSLAIALNLASTFCVILPGILLTPLMSEMRATAIFGILATESLLLLCALFVQRMLASSLSKRTLLASAGVGALASLPAIASGIFEVPALALFSAFALPMLFHEHIAGGTLLLAALGQWLAIALVSTQLTRQLQRAGASETKELMARKEAALSAHS